jgi:hypothetical protein
MENDPRQPRRAGSFRVVPRTGVIYVTTEARSRGFEAAATDWCNLGQGMPEAGPLPGAPPRVDHVDIDPADQEYAPVPGLPELREAVADLYNHLFRRGRGSKYSMENVAVAPGGRTSLTRAAASLGHVNLGHFLPDYTAYEELLDIFRLFSPIPILLEGERGYSFTADALRREILGRGLGAILGSNPCNPTGKVVGGEELAAWVDVARDLDCALLLDEFYSHYIWRPDLVARGGISSAAEFVDDVDTDPVVIFDGLTKNWRYPGWRVTWIVGPRRVIDAVASAGSFLDGGGSRPMQRAALGLLTEDHVRAETAAIRRTFGAKRTRMIEGLRALGVRIDLEPEGTFYCWGDLSDLPASIRSGEDFFRAALEEKVIVVPGEFFDVDPGRRRHGRPSRFRNHVRFSFGPEIAQLEEALERLAKVVDGARAL